MRNFLKKCINPIVIYKDYYFILQLEQIASTSMVAQQ